MSRAGEQNLMIDGPVGPLEAVLTEGEREGVLAVICHPNPIQGGTMQNKVVHTLMRTARDLGASTLRFNFRGVGASAGEHDYGNGEVDDCLAVLDWAQNNLEVRELWLLGFSFGGYVAAAAAIATAVDTALAIALAALRSTGGQCNTSCYSARQCNRCHCC